MDGWLAKEDVYSDAYNEMLAENEKNGANASKKKS
jgi:hypothetical protein